MSRWVLLPSPLLGPATWAPVADELVRRGRSVAVAATRAGVRTPEDVVAQLSAALPDEPGLVLVAHSNSGPYLAALAAGHRVQQLVFVDAGLPSSGERTPVAPAALRRHLEGIADGDGLLPPWTDWWPQDELRALLPDEESWVPVRREQQRLPLGYFTATLPSPPGWERLPAAYLAFGDTYAEERAEAVRRGWPVETLTGGHLHQLVAPRAVADALERLGD